MHQRKRKISSVPPLPLRSKIDPNKTEQGLPLLSFVYSKINDAPGRTLGHSHANSCDAWRSLVALSGQPSWAAFSCRRERPCCRPSSWRPSWPASRSRPRASCRRWRRCSSRSSGRRLGQGGRTSSSSWCFSVRGRVAPQVAPSRDCARVPRL